MVLLCATLPPRSLDSRFQETPCVHAGFSLVAQAPHPPSAPSPRSSRGEGQQGTCLARIWFVAPLPACGERVPKAGEGPCHERYSSLSQGFLPSVASRATFQGSG